MCLSNLRGLGQTVEMYLARYSQRYPFAAGGELWDLSSSPGDSEGGGYIRTQQFDFSIYWQSTMHEIAPWPQNFAAWVCPGSPRVKGQPWNFVDFAGRGQGVTSYELTYGFFADPKLWSGSAAADESLLHAITASDVLFPSSKTMMFDSENAHRLPRDDPDPLLQLFADGHVSIRRSSQARTPVTNPFLGTARYLLDTPNGVSGTDY